MVKNILKQWVNYMNQNDKYKKNPGKRKNNSKPDGNL